MLHFTQYLEEAWAQVGMDLVGPLHTTRNSNKYYYDYYTKWAEASALKDKTAVSVAENLHSVSKKKPACN